MPHENKQTVIPEITDWATEIIERDNGSHVRLTDVVNEMDQSPGLSDELDRVSGAEQVILYNTFYALLLSAEAGEQSLPRVTSEAMDQSRHAQQQNPEMFNALAEGLTTDKRVWSVVPPESREVAHRLLVAMEIQRLVDTGGTPLQLGPTAIVRDASAA